MSLVIRFSKTGKRGERKYRVVVKEKRSKREGDPVEFLGIYEKTTRGQTINIDQKKFEYWKSRGARPSDAVLKALANAKK